MIASPFRRSALSRRALLRAALRTVLETTTLADLAGGVLPAAVEELLARPDAWSRR
mgnify:CR=1 FL=1